MWPPLASIAGHSLDDLARGRHFLFEIGAKCLDDVHVGIVARGTRVKVPAAGDFAGEILGSADAMSNAPPHIPRAGNASPRTMHLTPSSAVAVANITRPSSTSSTSLHRQRSAPHERVPADAKRAAVTGTCDVDREIFLW
jgi:hypothetical protein